MIIKDDLFINGPNLCMRLEGIVNGYKKVIYLFGDYHSPLYKQKKCETFDSIDFTKYFVQTIKKTNKNITYDFLMEIRTDNYSKNQTDLSSTDIYIIELMKFFNHKIKIINENKVENDNMIEQPDKTDKTYKTSNTNDENLRLHIADNRHYFFTEKIFPYFKYLHTMINDIKINDINDNAFINLQNIINDINNEINLSLSFILNTEHKNNKIFEEDEHYKNLKKQSLKLLNKYKDENIKNKILNDCFFIEHIKKEYNNTVKYSNKIFTYLSKLNMLVKKYHYTLNEYNDYGISDDLYLKYHRLIEIFYVKYHTSTLNIFSIIMDMNNIRKIIDKKYLSNAIVYTGGYHSFNYMYVLIKNFNFKITHFTNNETTIDKLTEIIKTKKYNYKLAKYYFPKKLTQCINLKNFPDLFE
jgi:hypothetical protein